MTRIGLAVFLVLVSMSSTSHAVDCDAFRRTLSEWATSLDDFKKTSDVQMISCLFQGTDDKEIDALATTFNGILGRIAAADTSSVEQCVKSTDELQSILNYLANRAGESFGKVVVLCTQKGQAISLSEDLSQEEKQAQLERLLKAYLEQ